jgi:hypothetical protein
VQAERVREREEKPFLRKKAKTIAAADGGGSGGGGGEGGRGSGDAGVGCVHVVLGVPFELGDISTDFSRRDDLYQLSQVVVTGSDNMSAGLFLRYIRSLLTLTSAS